MGATMQTKTGPTSDIELTACLWAAGGGVTSGGGFGNVTGGGVPTPTWQLKAVNKYIKDHRDLPSWPLQPDLNPYANDSVTCSRGKTNKCVFGRGIPDISLIGSNTLIVFQGAPTLCQGTSVSAPVMAGLVAQINAYIRSKPGLQNKKVSRQRFS